MKKIFFRIFLSVAVLSTMFGGGFVAHAQNNSTDISAYESKLELCVFNDNLGTLEGCLVRSFYHLILRPSGWFAEKSAKLLDFFISYSLDSNSYLGGNGDFVNQGWTLIRDIANVVFIFVLLYIAIRHILSMGGDTKKLLISLIIAALLINFSLFFSKVIIDASNILARAFYNNIEVEFDDTTNEVKTISQALAAKVNPQKLLSSEIFSGDAPAPGQLPGTVKNGYAFFVMALAAAVNVIMAVVFLSSMLLFVARVIGLWFMMIFSPLAFASIAVPGGEGMLGQFGWKGWKDNMLKLSFMAPIFMFFLFLLVMFLQIVESAPIDQSQAATQAFMSVLIPFIVIIVVLQRAKKLAGDMAGEFGSSLTSVAGKAFSFIGGTALGLGAASTGMIARATVGRLAAKAEDNTWFKRQASNNRFMRQLYKVNSSAAKGSFDVRNSAGIRKTTGLLAQGLAAAGATVKVSAGAGTTKGGYVQRLEAYQKEKEKFKDEIKISNTAKQKIEERDKDGNIVTDSYGKPIVLSTSLQEAETDLLKKQNEAKNRVSDHDIDAGVDAHGNPITKTVSDKDYEGLVKEKEKAEKEKKQAEVDFANAQRNAKRNPDGSIDKTDAGYISAERSLAEAKAFEKGITQYVKDFEKDNWGKEEKLLKALEKQTLKSNAGMLRNYAESVNKGGLTTIYEMAKINSGIAGEARSAAAGNLALEAEKLGKKADDKKT